MKRLRVHRERGEQQVVGLGDGTAGLMAEDIAHVKFFEVFACHNSLVKAASCNCYITRSRFEFDGRCRIACVSPRHRRSSAVAAFTLPHMNQRGATSLGASGDIEPATCL